MVRYLKMWSALKFKDSSRPSSILLTVLAAEALSAISTEDLSGDDDYFRAVVSGVEGRLRQSIVVCNPVNDLENLNRLSDDHCAQFIGGLEELRSIADRALGSADEYESAVIWSEAFKHFFPLPKEDEQSADSAQNGQRLGNGAGKE